MGSSGWVLDLISNRSSGVKASGPFAASPVHPADPAPLVPTQEGCLWPSESTVSGNGIPEVRPGAVFPPPPAPGCCSGRLPGPRPPFSRRSLLDCWDHASRDLTLLLPAGSGPQLQGAAALWAGRPSARAQSARLGSCFGEGAGGPSLRSPPLQPQVYAPPRPTDRLAVPPFAQRDRCLRFQPTYPYLQHEIDLPPTISLSDGEEPPPYQGPCTLQLRDPEQQLELNRESVRAPPNRTIFDSDLMDSAVLGGPCPPSSNSGISATCYGGGGRMEGPPPTYSEVIGHYPGSPSFQHQQSSGPPSLLEGTRHPHAHLGPLESSPAWSKEKDKQKGHPL